MQTGPTGAVIDRTPVRYRSGSTTDERVYKDVMALCGTSVAGC